MSTTIANARIPGDRGLLGSIVNIHINDAGKISDIEFVGSTTAITIPARRSEGASVDAEIIDAGGRYVIPGLWDNHTHFTNWALTLTQADVSHIESAADMADFVGRWMRDHDGDLIGRDFRPSQWSERPHFAILDAVTGDRSVALISADRHSVWLNTAGLKKYGYDNHVDGYLVEYDAFRVEIAIHDSNQPEHDAAVLHAAQLAAARGVVGIVDLEFAWTLDSWRRRIAAGNDLLRVDANVYTEDLDRAIEAGLRTGDVIASTHGLLRFGRHKIISDGALGSRTAYCFHAYSGMSGPGAHGILNIAPSDLVPLMAKTWDAGIELAVHAIGDHANAIALDSFQKVKARGTIEHAQQLTHADAVRLAKSGIVASMQPEHAMDDRDAAEDLWAGHHDFCFPHRTILDNGGILAFGSDAPVAPLDPWFAIASAVHRSRDGREPWHPEQRISAQEALDASTRTRIAVGEVADLVLIESDPLDADVETLRMMEVSATFIAGRPTFLAL
ncbi:MAG: amidohydrolase [Microbacteriaceae bacterium]